MHAVARHIAKRVFCRDTAFVVADRDERDVRGIAHQRNAGAHGIGGLRASVPSDHHRCVEIEASSLGRQGKDR